MKTKLVYVLVCSNNDIFFEQTLVSAWSAKYHNPDVKIALVIDSRSKKSIDESYYCQLQSLIDEEIIVNFKEDVTNMVRSRWMKTKTRELVSGDFLYLDVDTIIVGDLSSLDDLACEVGFVYDFNSELKKNPSAPYYDKLLQNMFEVNLDYNGNYFNGGVFYVKDSTNGHFFLSEWHKWWSYCKDHGYNRDQLSLLKIVQENSNLVHVLDGSFNCQISTNISYLSDARILHFYSNHKYQRAFSPFLDKNFYLDIKQQKYISEERKEMIVNAKKIFWGPTTILSGDDFMISQSKPFEALCKIYRKKGILFKLVNFSAKVYLKIKS